MDLPELLCPTSADAALTERLACMMGSCFMEEAWTRALLDRLGPDADGDRKLAVSRSIMRHDFSRAVQTRALWATPDERGCAGAYLRSDLGDASWSDIETDATAAFIADTLSPDEAMRFLAAQWRMAPASVFDWAEQRAGDGDFIRFYALGVDPEHRGSGTFRRLIAPFLSYADRARIPCYLETYTARLCALYGHFGFAVVDVRTSADGTLVERCMERLPRARATAQKRFRARAR